MSSAITSAGEGEYLSVVGESIRILLDSNATGGKCVMFENISPVGNGPPLHRHGRDDEYFFVLEGTMKFIVDGRESIVKAGGATFAPRGSVHAFSNIGNAPCRMLVMCTPGGLEGPFREVDRLGRDGSVTMEALVAAFKRFDLEFVGPPLQASAASSG
ncbi:MAG TPA: cupin domain-containing protein [Phycisphaerae bacterium]|nr:cupin domain-containing protein [Phycisphaerae bacterium]